MSKNWRVLPVFVPVRSFRMSTPTLSFVPNLDVSDYDALIVVLSTPGLQEDFPGKDVALLNSNIDKKVGEAVTIHHAPAVVQSSRLVLTYTGIHL